MIYLGYLFIAYWIVITIGIIILEIIYRGKFVEDLPTAICVILIGPILLLIYFVIEAVTPILNRTIWHKRIKQKTDSFVVNNLPRIINSYNKYFKRRNIR